MTKPGEEEQNARYQIDAPTADNDTASSYSRIFTEREDADNAEWLEQLISDEEPAAQALDPNEVPIGTDPNSNAPNESAVEQEPQPIEAQDESATFGEMASAAIKDVATGVQEAPSQVVGGVLEAINEAGNLMQDLIPLPAIQLTDPETGEFDVKMISAEEFERLQAEGEEHLFEQLIPDEADSTTGNFVRSTSQFLAGFIPAMRGAKALGLTTSSQMINAAAAGVVADAVVFDPHEERLATFLNEIPALEAIVPDYLAEHDPERQSALEGRMKNAIEGLGLGLATDGLLRAFKYYKAQRAAKAQAKAGDTVGAQAQAARDAIRDEAHKDIIQDVTDEDLLALGDPQGPLVSFKEVDDTAEKAAMRIDDAQTRVGEANQLPDPAPKKKVFINHARIQTAEDVEKTLQALADADADDIGKRTRGTVSNDQTVRESVQEYRDLSDLLGRDPGPMSASKAVAARRALASSGEQIVALARKAQANDATKADIYNFRRAMAVHYALQSEVIAARTETARALQAWSIPVGATPSRSQAINDLVQQAGGASDMQQLARAVAGAADNPTAVNVMATELGKGRFGKAMYQVWINGLLSSPKTHAVNILSNAMTAVYAIPERYLSSVISKTFYNGEVDAGEIAAQAYGAMKGIRDGVRLVAAGNNAEGIGDLNDIFDAFVKTDQMDHAQAISAQAFGMDGKGGIGYGIDMLGKFVNLPGAALQAEDKFFKSIGYRMELNALAYRQAASEGLEGKEFAARVHDILQNPPSNLTADALDFAHYQTFTKPLGKVGRQFQQTVNRIPGARIVVPFIRTPTNIMKFTFERTPLAYMSGRIRADIRAGGARAAQAHARVALGSMAMLTIMDMSAEGTITGRGPIDPRLNKAKREEGWMPYSVKIGDRWYQYSRTDPIGMIMGLGADIAEITANASGEDADMVAAAGVLALANNLANKTYMSGIFDFIAAVDPSNPTSNPGRYLTGMSSTLIPYSSFVRNVATAADPTVRETKTVVYGDGTKPDVIASYFETLLNRQRKQIPGLSDELPPMRDLYGQEITRSSGIGWAWDFISPIASKADDPDPVTQVILDNQVPISPVPRQINGVSLTAEQYSEFAEAAGKPLRDYLGNLVKSPGFKRLSEGPDGMKAEMIRSAVNQFRERARAEMMMKHPDLRQRAHALKLDRVKTLQGANQ